MGGPQKVKDCGRQQLSVSLADGENTTKAGRPKRNTRRDAPRVHHRHEIGRYTYLPNISRLHSLLVADLCSG